MKIFALTIMAMMIMVLLIDGTAFAERSILMKQNQARSRKVG